MQEVNSVWILRFIKTIMAFADVFIFNFDTLQVFMRILY